MSVNEMRKRHEEAIATASSETSKPPINPQQRANVLQILNAQVRAGSKSGAVDPEEEAKKLIEQIEDLLTQPTPIDPGPAGTIRSAVKAATAGKIPDLKKLASALKVATKVREAMAQASAKAVNVAPTQSTTPVGQPNPSANNPPDAKAQQPAARKGPSAKDIFERAAKNVLKKWEELAVKPQLPKEDHSALKARAEELAKFIGAANVDYKDAGRKCFDLDKALDKADYDTGVLDYVDNYPDEVIRDCPMDADGRFERYVKLSGNFEGDKKAAAEAKFARTPLLVSLIQRAEAAYEEGRLDDAWVASEMAREVGEEAQKENKERIAKEKVAAEKLEREAWEKRCAEYKANGAAMTQESLTKADKGDLGDLKRVLKEVFGGALTLGKDEQSSLKEALLKGVLENEPRLKAVAGDLDLCADLISKAADHANVGWSPDVMKKLGDKEKDVAAKVLIKRCDEADVPDKAFETWMWETVDKDQWKDKTAGLSAQVFNGLWNAGKYDKVGELLKTVGDPSQAFSLAADTGRGTKEGIWSGFIQPLEHLLGNYVKKVDQLNTGGYDKKIVALESAVEVAKKALEQAKIDASKPGSDEEKEKAAEALAEKKKAFEEAEDDLTKTRDEIPKVRGAEKVLLALKESNKASVLTDYAKIQKSPMIEMFKKEPGTIWGFEDVRMPYVQAARETEHGQQPLRMWEMWEAIDPALDEKGYDQLLKDPDAAIRRFIALGVNKIKDGMKDAKKKHEYEGRDETEFIAKFKEQATTYLQHLAKQPPTKVEFRGVAEPSGVNPGKLMGGLGCKAGLWWAKEKKDPVEPVYYCIDGINMEDATSYKKTRNANIQAKLSDPSKAAHFEVITFAEIREILKNWDDLKDTVRFFEKGRMFGPEDAKRVEGWINDLKGTDKATGKRPAPKAEKFKDQLEKLDPDLIAHLEEKSGTDPDDGRNADRNALRIVRATENLKRSARAKRDVLVSFLKTKQCAVLVEWGFLPAGIADTYTKAVEATEVAQREEHLEALKKKLDLVHAEFKDAISKNLLEPFQPKVQNVT